MGIVLAVNEEMMDCFSDAGAVWTVWCVCLLDAVKVPVQWDVTCA